jgi:hypothetical protein
MRAAARRRTVRLAFELYSTGEYSLERLAKALTDRGYKHEAKNVVRLDRSRRHSWP